MTDVENKRAEGESGAYPFKASEVIEIIRAYARALKKIERLEKIIRVLTGG